MAWCRSGGVATLVAVRMTGCGGGGVMEKMEYGSEGCKSKGY